MEERVSFMSDKLRLSGVLHLPEPRGEKLAAFLVLHGFGSNKDGGGGKAVARMLTGLGYAALRFDFRGCGESEGARGRGNRSAAPRSRGRSACGRPPCPRRRPCCCRIRAERGRRRASRRAAREGEERPKA